MVLVFSFNLLSLEKRIYLGELKPLNDSTQLCPSNDRVLTDSVVNLNGDCRRQQTVKCTRLGSEMYRLLYPVL
jgi:hypothetical protein